MAEAQALPTVKTSNQIILGLIVAVIVIAMLLVVVQVHVPAVAWYGLVAATVLGIAGTSIAAIRSPGLSGGLATTLAAIGQFVEAFSDDSKSGKTATRSNRGRTKPLTSYQKSKLKKAVRFQCEIPRCNKETHLHVHHITPRADGGGNEVSNLIVVCRNHHAECDNGGFSRNDLRLWAKRADRFRNPDLAKQWRS